MAFARSKVNSQGEISIPSEIRRKLGIVPGSILEGEEEADKMIVRRTGRFSSADINRMLFPQGPPERKTSAELKEGIAEGMREKYAALPTA